MTELVIEVDGRVRMIYDEALDVSVLGNKSIQRASHVEPTAEGTWTADLSPVNGPVLGPFDKRSEALTAELSWLRQYWLQPQTIRTQSEEEIRCLRNTNSTPTT